MKILKSAFLGFICCAMTFPLFAESSNRHTHPQAKVEASSKQNVSWPGYCEIEIINNSFDDVRVYGVFDDGTSLFPFTVYSFESPHYISLYYYGFCHAGMDLYIDTWDGYPIYAGYTRVQTTVRVVHFMSQKPKVEVSNKE